MKCPRCNKNLQTKRTTAKEQVVERERFCKKCNKEYITVEFFKTVIDKEISDLHNLSNDCLRKEETVRSKFNSLKQSILSVIEIARQK